MIIDNTLDMILSWIKHAFVIATKRFGNFHNAHEGYAVLLEEVEELWENVKLNQSNKQRLEAIKDESIHVAAMAIRIIYDVVLKKEVKKDG